MKLSLIPQIQARHFTRVAAPKRRIDWVVLHSMENQEKPTGAENVARWWAGATSPQTSAHYCVDNDSVVCCVRPEDVAWAAPGANHNGVHVELCGRAAQTHAEWGDAFSAAMLKLAIELVVELCVAYDVPAVRVWPAGLKAGVRGITTHAHVSEAFRKSTHWDPGAEFPMGWLVDQVQMQLLLRGKG